MPIFWSSLAFVRLTRAWVYLSCCAEDLNLNLWERIDLGWHMQRWGGACKERTLFQLLI